MFNKDFLFSAIKRVFAGDPIKFKFYLSYNIVAFKSDNKKNYSSFFHLFLYFFLRFIQNCLFLQKNLGLNSNK